MRRRYLAHLLVMTVPYILINSGVDAAESGRPPGSASRGELSGASGEEGESEPCTTPVAPTPPQPPPGPSEEELRPRMERLRAEIEAHLREPNFHYLVCHNPTMQLKVVRLLEIHCRRFLLKYGIHPSDTASLSILASARQGTLLAQLRSPEMCDLVATYIEVSAGNMGEGSLIWPDQRRRGPRNFKDTLLLLQHVTATGQLLEFLQLPAGRYIFYVFFLTLLRRMARQGRRHLLLDFDSYLTQRIIVGRLTSELNDPLWRHQMITRLQRSDSVLKGAGTAGLPQPLEDEPPPPTSGSAPSTSWFARSTSGPAPSTSGSAPSTSGSAPSTSGSAPSTSGSAPSTSGSAPSTPGAAPSTSGLAPSTSGSALPGSGAAASRRPGGGNLGARPKSGKHF